MGSCQCSKDFLFLKQNLSEIFISSVEKKYQPQNNQSTTSNPNQKLTMITTKPQNMNQQQQQQLPSSTLINPNPTTNNTLPPIKPQKTIKYQSTISNDNYSRIGSVCLIQKVMNDSFTALDSKSHKKNFRRQFTDAHIDLTIIDTNIFNELINEINIVILGGIKVGKSSFVIKVTEQRFEKLYIPTIAVEIKSKTVQYRNKTIKLNFIVTPGDKQYKEDYTPLYEKANFIFLYYDTSNENSFNEAKQLLYEEVCEYAGLLKIGVTNFYFIGNKVDLAGRNISINTIQTFCKKHKLDLFEISVKSGYGIKLLMNNVLNKYIDFMNNKS